MSNIKEQIKTDLKQAKETGQLRAERIREIVQSAVSELASEVRIGSSELRILVKDAVAVTLETLQEKGGEIKEEVMASIEGAIEGISRSKHQKIAETQAEVKQLQDKLDNEENELQQEIESLLTEIEATGQEAPPHTKIALDSAINTLKDSEEVALMKKRYAQLQAQLAIVRANLAARYGGRTEEVKGYLEEAKNWYSRSRTHAEAMVEQVEQKRSQVEEKLGEAGTALAQKERKIRQILSDLLRTASDMLKEKEHPHQ